MTSIILRSKNKAKQMIKSLLSANDSSRSEQDLGLITGCNLPHKVLIGTHHKTGTVWMSNIFKQTCKYHSLIFYSGEQNNLPDKYDVFFQNHSDFDLESINGVFRGIHIIRDPRDMIVSACFYHQKSSEDWLHVPNIDFGGQTYQEKINSFQNFDDKLLFEMENSAERNIKDIIAWDYTDARFLTVKYEDLIDDDNLLFFHNIFTFLGFPGSAIPSCLAIAYKNSLFSGSVKSDLHVRSGKANQWKEYFKPIHKKRYIEIFGDSLIKLKYEVSNEW